MVLAQGSVKGKVIDRQTNEALQFVNIRVTQDEKLVKGAITDVDGAFNITGLSDGSYVLTVSYVGYRDLTRRFSLTPEDRRAHFNALFLTEDSKALKEVTVTGQRSQMKLEVDRKTFTVDQMIAGTGGSASELLEQIPSIEVTTDGEISLRGNSSVEVWINGKASGLTSDNRGDILQQIPAESIERIEVIDNPSAKFSPEGSAGIINIVLKRDRKAGYYGSVRVGGNNHGGWHTGGNINYSSGQLDAFANIGYRRRKGSGGSLSEQEYLKTNTYQNYESESNNGGGGLFARMGVTWHLTQKDDLTLTGMTLQGSRDDGNTTPYYYGRIGAPRDSYVMYRRNTNDGNNHMYHGELGYDHNWSEQHKLKTVFSMGRWTSDNDNVYQDSIRIIDATSDVVPDSPAQHYQYRPLHVNNRSMEAKVDYENQLTEKFKVEAGYNGRFTHENTPQESWQADNWQGTGLVVDASYYNRFIYDMSTHALYATITTSLGRLGIMGGLRGEYWRINTESYDYRQEHDASLRDTPFKKDYFQLFPSLFLNYQLTETAQLQLNYTRRLRRPWGGQLNSFKNTSDASMVSFGNPLLTPEYTNSFSLNFLKTWPEHTLSISTYYRPTTDVIQRIRYQGADGLMYMTSENVAKNQRAGVELIVKDKLFRILDLTTTLNGFYYKVDGFSYQIMGQTVTGTAQEDFSWNARVLASVILPYDISIQATGNYRSRGAITQGYRKPNGSLDLGLRKTFFNKKLAVSVNWRDVFNSRHWENYTSSDTFTRHQKNWRDPRVNLTVSWNFGNMNQKKEGEEGTPDNQQPILEGVPQPAEGGENFGG
ncbi:MAG: TonB-dependent receptor [Prevotella sp.]|nr:TonB-dependent receptor [Prevotella sp.]